jgi:tRNA pseudouridine55 synthase
MHEIINLNKPSGMTSHQATAKVKRLLNAKKAGHTGTLDPLATGVLLVCLDEATKITRFLLDMDKRYRARIKLGQRTDTNDSEGVIIEERDVSSVTEAQVVNVAMQFVGRIKQKPPMYSAVKVGGERLYRLARRGIEIERPERTVDIYDVKIMDINIPFVELEISCSKGTYIRTLCDDIGIRLGTGAHIVALERTAIGFFCLEDSTSFNDLEDGGLLAGSKYVCGIDLALSGLSEVLLDQNDYRKASNGMQIISNKIRALQDSEFVRLKDPDGKLFGIGRINSGIINIERLLKL